MFKLHFVYVCISDRKPGSLEDVESANGTVSSHLLADQ